MKLQSQKTNNQKVTLVENDRNRFVIEISAKINAKSILQKIVNDLNYQINNIEKYDNGKGNIRENPGAE
jgi:hypothetical protein